MRKLVKKPVWQKKDLLGIEYLSVDEMTLILDTADSFKEVSTRPINSCGMSINPSYSVNRRLSRIIKVWIHKVCIQNSHIVEPMIEDRSPRYPSGKCHRGP